LLPAKSLIINPESFRGYHVTPFLDQYHLLCINKVASGEWIMCFVVKIGLQLAALGACDFWKIQAHALVLRGLQKLK
jgi:hypothetical protein